MRAQELPYYRALGRFILAMGQRALSFDGQQRRSEFHYLPNGQRLSFSEKIPRGRRGNAFANYSRVATTRAVLAWRRASRLAYPRSHRHAKRDYPFAKLNVGPIGNRGCIANNVQHVQPRRNMVRH